MSLDPYDLIAALYDREHAGFADDVALYERYAAQTGGPILELACGSGRLTIPMAEAGYAITGTDRAAAMLQRARAAADAAGPDVASRITWRQAEMTDPLEHPPVFRLAFIGLGSFNHLATLAERVRALRAIRASVVPGALLILDIAQADARRFTTLAELGTVAHVVTLLDDDGTTVLTHTVAAQPTARAATLSLTHWYDTHRQGEPVTRVTIETPFALITSAEMELALGQTGWRPRQWFGDHEMGPWDESTQRMIIVAQATEAH